MKVALFLAHGIQNPQFYVEKLRQYDSVIAVDESANFCKEWGIVPDILLGDFDSISEETMEYFRGNVHVWRSKEGGDELPLLQKNISILHRPSQETTDLEEAILYAKKQYPTADIDILGGISANEFDHTLSNVLFLRLLPKKSKILTEFQEIFLIQDATSFFGKKGDLLSCIALEKIENLSYTNLKYPLKNAVVPAGWCGTRNRFIENECHISFSKGMLLVVHSF